MIAAAGTSASSTPVSPNKTGHTTEERSSKVSTSAAEARDLGFLAPSDRIVFGRDRLIAEAKRFALDLSKSGEFPGYSENIWGITAAILVNLSRRLRWHG